MNESKAREILGCKSNSTFKEIRSNYRKMIMLAHPDKVNQDFKSQERAKEISSRLNLAWEYLERREKEGLLGKPEIASTGIPFQARGRMPNTNECDICGFENAIRISAPFVKSFIYFFRRGKYEFNLCKFCGFALSRMALRETLIKGWWGVGVVFIPYYAFKYFGNSKKLGKMNNPGFRVASVISMSEYPLLVPPTPFKQPLPILASSAAILIILSNFLGAFTGQSSTPDTFANPSAVFKYLDVDCDLGQPETGVDLGTGSDYIVVTCGTNYFALTMDKASYATAAAASASSQMPDNYHMYTLANSIIVATKAFSNKLVEEHPELVKIK